MISAKKRNFIALINIKNFYFIKILALRIAYSPNRLYVRIFLLKIIYLKIIQTERNFFAACVTFQVK